MSVLLGNAKDNSFFKTEQRTFSILIDRKIKIHCLIFVINVLTNNEVIGYGQILNETQTFVSNGKTYGRRKEKSIIIYSINDSSYKCALIYKMFVSIFEIALLFIIFLK